MLRRRSSPPEDFSAFEMLNEIIQYEPTELFDTELVGRLATLGIEKGKGWNMLWRIYGPLEPWFDKTLRPGEVELQE